MTKLTYEERKELPQGEFVFPKTRRYPIEDAAHARDALARSSGKPGTRGGCCSGQAEVSRDRCGKMTNGLPLRRGTDDREVDRAVTKRQ